ncbi:hypothetical protein LJ739_15105 [Aestuariibacter halophilus]|uniref:Uncharacterized protein n=1 Tax=Fluctibacter halophilus TaxID=226011 RepID=A0ABS8GCM7_9ALTE|nr:hypothetical protein [Aestuariibacter halophilus]MCC2617580.1 hypothetical protein [Aestuariibacter halophilus]
MKHYAMALAATMVWVSAAHAQETPDAELLNDLKGYCLELAEEDGLTDAAEKDAYVLNCVNEELEAEGYAPISSLEN